MALTRQLQYAGDTEELPLPPTPIVDESGDTGWWNGIAQSLVAVAVAGIVAANTLSAQLPLNTRQPDDEIPAASLRGSVEEESWQNWVAPAPLSFVVPSPWQWEQHEQAAGLYGVLDDESGALRFTPPAWAAPPLAFASEDERPTNALDVDDVAPSFGPSAAPRSPSVFSTDDEFATPPINFVADDEADWPAVAPPASPNGSAIRAFIADEEFRPAIGEDESAAIALPSTLPSSQRFTPPAFTDDEIPAARLYGQWDDEGWQNAVRPTPQLFIVPAPWSFEQHELAGGLTGRTEDEYWQNRVAPIDQAFLVPAPWTYDQQEPAGQLRGQPDEDGWIPPAPRAIASLFTSFVGDDEFAPASLDGADDAIPPPLPTRAAGARSAFAADEEFARSTAALEDEAAAPRLPSAWLIGTTQYTQPLAADDEYAPYAVDDDAWFPPRPSVALSPALLGAVLGTDEEYQPPALEESEWLLPRARLRADPSPASTVFRDDEPWPPGQLEEECWANPVRPVPHAFARPWAWWSAELEPEYARPLFKTPHHVVAALTAEPRSDATIEAFPRAIAALASSARVDASLTSLPRAGARLDITPRVRFTLQINGVTMPSTTTTPADVRINASNVLKLSVLTDLLNANGTFTNVAIAVRITGHDGAELTPTTTLPANQAGTVWAVTVSKTDAAFQRGVRYTAQFSGTMKDADNNDVDYYEELELIGVAR